MITTFWSWFQQSEAEIRHDLATKNQMSFILDELGRQLDVISPALNYELLMDNLIINPSYTLSISCNGDRDYFMLVKTMVDHAPVLPKWNIVPFIQAKGDPEELIAEEIHFDSCAIIPNMIQFAIDNCDYQEGIFDLVLLLPLHLRQVGDEKLGDYLFYLFQDLWGEMFVGRRINAVRWIYHHHEDYFFFDLEDLQFVLENFGPIMS